MLSLNAMVSSAKSRKRARKTRFPDRIGRYRILLPIASGGMATVYLARTTGPHGFSRDVALKLTHEHLRENKRFAEALYREAKIAARIRHRNVVQVTEVGNDPLGVFLVMEYIEGDTLSSLRRAARKRGQRLDPRVGLRILVDALRGLHAAHELRDDSGQPMGLIHRDFSPQNILVGLDGVGLLTDFGIAKAMRSLEHHTATGVIKGKLTYMAPEQARGSKDLDRRADVWSGGVMAWEILTGQRLYGEETEVAILLKLVSEAPPRVDEVEPSVPKDLADVVQAALTMDREQRIATAEELANRLTEVASAHGLLAETTEVARYVREMLGPKLDERRRRIDEASDLDRHRSQLAEQTISSALESNSDLLAAFSDSEGSEGGDSSEEVSGLAPPVPPPPPAPPVPTNDESSSTNTEPAVIPPPKPPVSRDAESSSSAVRPSDITGTDTISISAGMVPPAPPSVVSRTKLVLTITAAVVTASIAAVVLFVTAAPDSVAPASAAPSMSPSTGFAAPVASSAPDSSSTTQSSRDVSHSVDIRASAPVARVDVGKRRILIEPPSSVVRVELREDEANKPVSVTFYSTDGRRVAVVLDPDLRDLELEFPSAEGSENKQRHKSSTGKRRIRPRVWVAPRKKNDTGLAPNPYGGK